MSRIHKKLQTDDGLQSAAVWQGRRTPNYRLGIWQGKSQQKTACSTYEGNHQKDDYLLDTKLGHNRKDEPPLPGLIL
jgi:hypothetical protein